MTTLYGPQRERLLAALEARQAEEERRMQFGICPSTGWSRVREALTGTPSCWSRGCERRLCETRATGRFLVFWVGLMVLSKVALIGYGLWVWRPQ